VERRTGEHRDHGRRRRECNILVCVQALLTGKALAWALGGRWPLR